MSLWELSEALAAPPPAAADFPPLELDELDDLADLDALDALVGEEISSESESTIEQVSDHLADDVFRLAFESAEPTSTAHDTLEAQLLGLNQHDFALVEHHPESPASAISSELSSDESSSLEDELDFHPGLDHDDLLSLLHPDSPPAPDSPHSPDSPVSITTLAIGAPPRERADSGASSGAAAAGLKLERKEWTAAEDAIILTCVSAYGCRWRKIAAQLPGRSDDAVRNRYARLKGDAKSGAAAGAAVCSATTELALIGGMTCGSTQQATRKVRAPGADDAVAKPAGGAKPERVSWTRVEDETILRCVLEWGNKWGKIAACLPGRTEHAIRNRFARLQAIYAAQEQRVPAAVAAF